MTATEPASTASPLPEGLRLAALGWRVVPIGPGLKFPKMKAWQEHASSDPHTIESWFSGLYRGHGLGVATGLLRPGTWLFVLDVDEKPGISGAETLADLETTWGPLPATVESQTGSGGRHLYFLSPEPIQNDQQHAPDIPGRLGWGLDLRGVGGQVLAPPTLHPITKRPYTWIIGQDPGEHEVAWAPDWLVELARQEPHPLKAPTVTRDPGAPDDGPAARYNASTTWAELLERDGWTLHHVDRDGEQHWTRPGKDRREGSSATVGHQGRDVLRVFTSGVSWLAAGAYSRFGYTACREHGGDRSAAARAIVEVEESDRAPWRERLETVARDRPATAGDEAGEAERDPLLDQLLDWTEFWSRDRVGEEWFVQPFWPARRAISLVAPGGAGKSLLALYVAANMACGRPVFGQAVTARSVLYLDYEMTADDLAERLEAMGFGPDVDMANLHYALIPTLPPLDSREGALTVVRLSEMVGAEAIVIDTFARAVQGEEDKADTVRNFYRHTGMALKRAGRAWLRVDHSGKDREKGARGTSAKRDDVDVEWELVALDGGVFTLKATKRRVSWVPEQVQLQRVDDDVLEFRLPAGTLGYTLPAGSGECADRLDALGAPLTISSRQAATLLAEHGKRTRASIVRGALKWRRDKATRQLENASRDTESATGRSAGRTGTHLSDEAAGVPGRTPDALANPLVSDSGRTRDAADAPDQSNWDAPSPLPPLRGEGLRPGTTPDTSTCPDCGGSLASTGDLLACLGCGTVAPVAPNLLVDDWPDTDPTEGA